MMYQYWGFGLHIASEIAFPELLPAAFTSPDVTIATGITDGNITGQKATHHDLISIINDTDYYLDIFGVCKYHVVNINTIHIDPYAGIDSRSVRLYLLGSVMAYVLFRRGSIPLHASGIIRNEKLILFTGDSGAGKSTTSALLAKRGYTIFTDDICVLDNDGRGTACYPMIKLWEDARQKLNSNTYDSTEFSIRPGQDKYGYFFHQEFLTNAVPIHTIFVIRVGGDITDYSHQQLTGIKAFDALAAQVYRRYLLVDAALRILYFKTISALANSCSVIEINRPVADDPMLFIDQVEALLNRVTTA